MSYKNEVKMYKSRQAQESRLDSPNISLSDQTLYFLKKSDNLQYNTLVRWANGINDSLDQVTLFENESIIDINYPDLLAPDLG